MLCAIGESTATLLLWTTQCVEWWRRSPPLAASPARHGPPGRDPPQAVPGETPPQPGKRSTGCETVTGAMKTPGHSRRAIAAIALTACCAVAGPTGKAAGQAGEQGG
jgi:hypothetical protein